MFYCTASLETVLRSLECGLKTIEYNRTDNIFVYPSGLMVHDFGLIRIFTPDGKMFVATNNIPINKDPEKIVRIVWSKFAVPTVNSVRIYESSEFISEMASTQHLSFAIGTVEVANKKNGVIIWAENCSSHLILKHELQKYNPVDLPEDNARCDHVVSLLGYVGIIPQSKVGNAWCPTKNSIPTSS